MLIIGVRSGVQVPSSAFRGATIPLVTNAPIVRNPRPRIVRTQRGTHNELIMILNVWKSRLFASNDANTTIVLEPPRGWSHLDLSKLFAYRDLLVMLAMRDIKVRYKQTALGVLWAVIQPLVLMIVFRTFLGRYTGMTDPVALYAGLLPWTLFALAVTASSQSLVSNSGLLKKVYFPRLILPTAGMGAPLIDFALAFIVLIGLMLWQGAAFSVTLVLLPVFLASMMIAAVGVGLGLSALTVTYRDFRLVVPFMLQVWFFTTPVIYHVPRWFSAINPIGGSVSAFRAAVTGQPIDFTAWLCSLVISLSLLLVGTMIFAQQERKFADVV